MMDATNPRQFHQNVETLKQRVAKMGEMSRMSVRDGVKSLVDLDEDLAQRTIDLNQDINRMDVDIEHDALNLIGLHQPMAKDLRTIGASIKIITYLDRIGRYGYDVAEIARDMTRKGTPHMRKLVSIPYMATLAEKMVADALEAYLKRDLELARHVYKVDDDVDALYDQIYRECVTYMLEDPKTITSCAQYILIARHLERVADNACKIAEKTIYMISGERRLPT